jgi:hypothetical protein
VEGVRLKMEKKGTQFNSDMSSKDIFGEDLKAISDEELRTKQEMLSFIKSEILKVGGSEKNQFIDDFSQKATLTSFDPYNPGFT